jgi:hypothetical protein
VVKGACLLPREPHGSIIVCWPLKEDRLIWEFSELYDKMEQDEDRLRQAILCFANKYGFLQLTGWFLSADDEQDDGVFHRYGYGTHCEPLAFWKEQICRINRAVELLKLLRRIDGKYVLDEGKYRDRLSELIEWEKPKYWPRYWRDDVFGYRGAEGAKNRMQDCVYASSNPWLEHCYPDLTVAARQIVAHMVNNAIEKECHSRIMWTPFPKRNASDRDPHFLAFHIVPDSLLAVMWLQVGQWLIKERRYNWCQNPTCTLEPWFEVGTEKRRSDSRYCSTACKMAVNNTKRPSTRAGRMTKVTETGRPHSE